MTMNGITSTFGLIGVFLAFKNGPIESDGRRREIGSVEHIERFRLWWCSLGTPAGHRAGVVHAIAEKVNLMLPELFESGPEQAGPCALAEINLLLERVVSDPSSMHELRVAPTSPSAVISRDLPAVDADL